MNILEWLQGKRTYIVAILLIVFNLGVGMQWWTPDNHFIIAIDGILAAFGFGFLRVGINHDTKKKPSA